MTSSSLTADQVRAVLVYDDTSGDLRWKVSRGKGKAGQIAGRVNQYGYRRVRVFDHHYQAHRIVWLIIHGRWPDAVIDHINGNRLDNRISNLREASPAINQQNRRRASRQSRSGILGVQPSRTKWRARIEIAGRKLSLGTYSTATEAGAAYIAAKRRLHEGCTI